MGALLLIGVLFFLIGVAVLIGGVVAAVKQSRESANAAVATGLICAWLLTTS